MRKVLIVIDMQNDFISETLGTPEAQKILPLVVKKAESFKGEIVFTRDTHEKDYLTTQEGKYLPVEHCIHGSYGWEIADELKGISKDAVIIDKPTFGSIELGNYIAEEDKKEHIDEVTLIGLCTDICVISNAMILKAKLPETKVVVDSSCCAGVSPESHETALKAMKGCQIVVV